MAKTIVTDHRFSVEPLRKFRSKVQPYDSAKDRPETAMEGAHLAQYYSDAWLEATHAVEQLEAEASEALFDLKSTAEAELDRLKGENSTLSGQLDVCAQKLSNLQSRRDVKIAYTLLATGAGFVLGAILGAAMG